MAKENFRALSITRNAVVTSYSPTPSSHQLTGKYSQDPKPANRNLYPRVLGELKFS